ncbi:MAG: hypothetical protein AABY05_01765 [Nanoarchaeota archaeon]
MKRAKRKINHGRADSFAVTVFLISGFYLLNGIKDSMIVDILGICCFIVAVYGIVCIGKTGRFIFGN